GCPPGVPQCGTARGAARVRRVPYLIGSYRTHDDGHRNHDTRGSVPWSRCPSAQHRRTTNRNVISVMDVTLTVPCSGTWISGEPPPRDTFPRCGRVDDIDGPRSTDQGPIPAVSPWPVLALYGSEPLTHGQTENDVRTASVVGTCHVQVYMHDRSEPPCVRAIV